MLKLVFDHVGNGGSRSQRKQEKHCCMKCVDVELREYELPKVDCVCCVEEGKEEPRALPWRTLHQQLTQLNRTKAVHNVQTKTTSSFAKGKVPTKTKWKFCPYLPPPAVIWP